MKFKEDDALYFNLLERMKNSTNYYHDLDRYKDRYTDFEFKVRKQISKDEYTEAYYAFIALKRKMSIIKRFRLWCVKWLKKLRQKK